MKTSKEERELRLSAVAQSYGRICFTTCLESFQGALEDVIVFNGLPTPKKTQFPETCCLEGSECVGIVCLHLMDVKVIYNFDRLPTCK